MPQIECETVCYYRKHGTCYALFLHIKDGKCMSFRPRESEELGETGNG